MSPFAYLEPTDADEVGFPIAVWEDVLGVESKTVMLCSCRAWRLTHQNALPVAVLMMLGLAFEDVLVY